jgi:predicted small metal-binding protein
VAPKFSYEHDAVPACIAGVMTVKCECGWEMVFIQPEEHINLLNFVFEHLKKAHNVVFPQICCFWH